MMTNSIVLISIGAILLNIIAVIFERKMAKMQMHQEWSLDQGVYYDYENKARDILSQYGKSQKATLPKFMILPPMIRNFVECYSSLEFDDFTKDYDRQELIRGEEQEKPLKGFYCIGGDGGEISFYVRKSKRDETIYAFDMEGSEYPTPYASNILRFLVMRYNAWCFAKQSPN